MDSSSSNEKLSQAITVPTLEDLIQGHLVLCSKCNPPIKPVALGQKNGFCDGYWIMVQRWSDREGKLNNIVAQDEYGHLAPRNLPA
jgi:hypothetical protein